MLETVRQSRRARLIVMMLLVGLAVGLPVLMSVSSGSLTIPHNDAWSHARIAMEFARSGTIELLGWNRAALLGQIVLLGPLGASITAQNLFGAVTGVLGLWATYDIMSRRLGYVRALFGTAIVASFPGFGLLATSYMTDLPAFAALMWALAFIDRAQANDRRRWLVAAVLATIWGVTVREQVLVVVVLLVVVGCSKPQRDLRVAWFSASGVVIAAWLIFETYRRALPNGDSPVLRVNLGALPVFIETAVMFIGFVVAPAVLLTARPRSWGVGARIAGSVGVLFGAIVVITTHGYVFPGNYLDVFGAYADAAYGQAYVLPNWLWRCVELVTVLSVGALAAQVWARQLVLDRIGLTVIITLAGGTLVQVAIGQRVFDRYLLPLIPFLLIAILRQETRGRRWLGVSVLVLMQLVTLLLTANALAFDAVRWQQAEVLTRSGTPAQQIDAGIEWNGFHTREPFTWAGGGPGWCVNQPYRAPCLTVARSEIPGFDVVATVPYKTFLVAGQSWAFVQRSEPQ